MNAALEERANANKILLEKAVERQIVQRVKLDKEELAEHATYEELPKVQVKELDLQIDKVQSAADRLIWAKSMIPNKEAKIKETLAAFERRRKILFQETSEMNTAALLSPNLLAATEVIEEETYPDDMELSFNDEVVF